jgi:hypothetical protein
VKFFIEAGAFFDFIVFRIRKAIHNEVGIDNTTMFSSSKPDFGISGGIGLRIPIKKCEILIKSNYKWGMLRIFRFSDIIFYNQYFRFTLGFKANFTPKEKK